MNKHKYGDETEMEVIEKESKRVQSRFKSDQGEDLPGGLLDLPVNITVEQLRSICNALLQEEEPMPLAFYVNDTEITDTLEKSLGAKFNASEDVVEIIYQPQAVFKVRAVTRCTGSMEGSEMSFFFKF